MLLMCFSLLLSFSQTNMPSFFADNMVLQQNENVQIWGTDKPNQQINIKTSWGENKSTITGKDGSWKTTILTNKASFKTQTVTIKGTSTRVLNNVLLGEVWFCSGQSNMEMPMRGFKNSPINNSEFFIASSKNSNIRLFNAKRSASLTLENNIDGSWEEATPKSVKNFSAVGYFFAKTLFAKLQIPIAIIEASWGGTKIECWLPKLQVVKYDNIKIPDSLPLDEKKQKQPTLLYNAMIYPFRNYNIKGFLWYQGETNRSNPSPYKDYMHTLIMSWREQWRQNHLPFYFVQIAPYSYNQYRNSPVINANLIREAQSLVVQQIPNTGVVVTADVGKCNDIHPPEKEIIANRLANWALAKQYGLKDISYRSPEFKKLFIKKNKAILSFNFYEETKPHVGFKRHKNITNFELAGTNRIFYPAKAKIYNNKTIIVSSTKVKNPVAVRYGFQDCLQGSLFSNTGLPVSPFRTDNWDK